MNPCGILLAAGSSSRMGRPKQLLRYQGQTLIRRAAERLLAAGVSRAVVVLGASAPECVAELEGLAIVPVVNASWATGMGSSLVVGLQRVLADEPAAPGVLITLCDQVAVTPDVLVSLIHRWRERRAALVACRYGATIGVPALFDSRLFSELLALEPSAGAKRVIDRHITPDATVDFPEGSLDVDTPDDYARLTRGSGIGAKWPERA